MNQSPSMIEKFKNLTSYQRGCFYFLTGLNLFFFFVMFALAEASLMSCFGLFGIFQGGVLIYYYLVDNSKIKSVPHEWIDAIIFAIVAATFIRTFFIEAFTIPTSSMEKSLLVGDFLFVSKVNYGARVPMTPLSFPFTHHTLPFTEKTKSYVELFQLPYYRLPGFAKIKNNQVVVFNYPMEDFRPVDKMENYIKRCIGIPGDTLQVSKMKVSINGKIVDEPLHSQYDYIVRTDGSGLNPVVLKDMDVTEGGPINEQGYFHFFLTSENAEKIRTFKNVLSVEHYVDPRDYVDSLSYPFVSGHQWSIDNYGPVLIPARGMKIQLSRENIGVYRRAISVYEKNSLEEKDGKFIINGKETSDYTFKMDYYWMMGDNRHNSLDSRYWGFVPEDHIVGKAVFVWFSWDTNGNFLNKIRWSRLFKFIN